MMIYAQNNLPLSKPGIYQIRNVANDKVYVGISANLQRRATEHASGLTTTKKIKSAIKESPNDFVFEPLFYLCGGNDYEFLMDSEAALIAEKNSVMGGYNARASSGRGRAAGPEYGAAISRALQLPEEKARRSAASKAYKARPGVREAHTAAMKAWFAANKDTHTNTVRAKSSHISSATKAAMRRPEVIENMRKANASALVKARRSEACKKANEAPSLRKAKSDGMKRVWAARKAALITGSVSVTKEVTT